MKNPELSIVVPCYNEELNISPLYKSLIPALKSTGKSFEIIIVDDGSTDRTFEQLRKLHGQDRRVIVLRFGRNFGKASALAAGFEKASGNLIVTMDADLQDEPAEIPRLIAKIKEGYDLVVGWKYPRRDPITKIIPSRIFNFLIRRLMKIKLHDNDCNFRCMKKEIIPNLNLYGGLFRYIPVLAYSKGYRVTEIKVRHNPRKYGKSKWGFARLYKGFFDLLTLKFLITFRESPAYLFSFIGFSLLGLGFIDSIYLLYLKFGLGETIGARPALLLAVLLILLGAQFISLGLLGEMITYQSQKQEKVYRVREVLE